LPKIPKVAKVEEAKKDNSKAGSGGKKAGPSFEDLMFSLNSSSAQPTLQVLDGERLLPGGEPVQVSSPTDWQVTSGGGEERRKEKEEGLAIPLESHAVIETKIYS